jgi:hypothetical protein
LRMVSFISAGFGMENSLSLSAGPVRLAGTEVS